MMLGTWLNAGAIVMGALLGLTTRWEISVGRQQLVKVALGVATAWFGLMLVWKGLTWNGALSGTVKLFFHQFAVVLVTMVVGSILGKLCGLQRWMNRLGQSAKERLEKVSREGRAAAADGFVAATLLFCAAPLGWAGALEDGLIRYFQPLAIKAVMDGLAAFSFARLFGWTALLVAVPVTAFLTGVSLLADRLEPWLAEQGTLGVVHATLGFIITYVALVIFEIKKVEMANYLPCLVVAPLLMRLSQMLF